MKITLTVIIVLVLSFSVTAQREIAEKYKNSGTEKAKTGNYEAALEDLTKAIQIDPTYAAAYNNRGIVKMKQEDYSGAITDFTKAIELDATDAAYYKNRATTKSKMNIPGDAIEDYGMALKLSPDDATMYYKRGLLRKETGNFKAAVQDLDKAIEMEPDNGDLYYYRGLIKLCSNEFDDGHKDFFRAAELGQMKAKMMITGVFFDNIEDNKIFGLATRASMKFYLKDFAGAITDLDALLKLSPKNSKAWFNRGLSKILTDDKEGGCLDLRKSQKYGYKEAAVQITVYCE